jgi:hypothetical protein
MYGTCDCNGGLGRLGYSPVQSFPAGTDWAILSPIESGPIDPVTFEPEPVVLTLEYPTYDMSPVGFERLKWGLPLWAGIAVGAYVLANYAGGRI